MKLRAWIDEVESAEGGGESEAIRERASAPGNKIPGGLKWAGRFLLGEAEADEILFAARDQIIAGGVYHFTPETDAAELEINRTYKAILAGGSDFDSLRAACFRWVAAARTKPAPSDSAGLFPD